jgi:hypothetical protein
MRNMARMALAERRRKMATMADSGSSSDGSSGDEEEEGTGAVVEPIGHTGLRAAASDRRGSDSDLDLDEASSSDDEAVAYRSWRRLALARTKSQLSGLARPRRWHGRVVAAAWGFPFERLGKQWPVRWIRGPQLNENIPLQVPSTNTQTHILSRAGSDLPG